MASVGKDGSISVTCTAPINIAVIKYWGKRDTKLVLPINSSLSLTVDQGSMMSKTTITASKSFNGDTMSLNGKSVNIQDNSRMTSVIETLRKRAQNFYDIKGTLVIRKDDWPRFKLQIVSENNFPTAAGLASSASGFACLTSCLTILFGVKELYPGELSTVARLGSGSACRSMYGGFVKWNKGEEKDGRDSIATQVALSTHWPEMRILVVVTSTRQKETGSTEGMQQSVETSPLLLHRAKNTVPGVLTLMETAIQHKNFEDFATLTMKDSNQFHAICLDTFPPIFYLNETSHRIIQVVHAINKCCGRTVAAYTFDAGSNAVVFVLQKDIDSLLALFLSYWSPSHGKDSIPTLTNSTTDQTNSTTDQNESRENNRHTKQSKLHRADEKQGCVDEFLIDRLELSTVTIDNYTAFIDTNLRTAVGDRVKADQGVEQIIVSKVGQGPTILDPA